MNESLIALIDGAVDTGTLACVLTDLCREHLPESKEFDEDTGFFESGLTSKALTEVMMTLKEHDVPVGLIDFFRMPNVGLLSAELSRRLESQAP